jgi:PTS system ascorbate-specific IIA component
MGKRPLQVRQMAVTVHDDPDVMLPLARSLVRELDQGQGVVVLTDIMGATPANIATRLEVPEKVAVVSGANLPMLIRALTYRNESLATVVSKAVSGGREGVQQLGETHAAGRG